MKLKTRQKQPILETVRMVTSSGEEGADWLGRDTGNFPREW